MAERGAKRKAETKQPRRELRAEWLDQFKGWLEPVPDEPTRAFCKICVKGMNAELTQLERHEVNIPRKIFKFYKDP